MCSFCPPLFPIIYADPGLVFSIANALCSRKQAEIVADFATGTVEVTQVLP